MEVGSNSGTQYTVHRIMEVGSNNGGGGGGGGGASGNRPIDIGVGCDQMSEKYVRAYLSSWLCVSARACVCVIEFGFLLASVLSKSSLLESHMNLLSQMSATWQTISGVHNAKLSEDAASNWIE